MTEPIDGAALLNEVEHFHRRFNVFPSEAAYVATVLWNAHTHLLECFDSTPRLGFLSPEPGSGKTRALEVVGTLIPNPMHAVSASPAALFRAVADKEGRPCILFDEIDTVFGPKVKDGNEDLRCFLNAGHRRSGVFYRCVGDGANQTVAAFPAYSSVAVAGLGYLPDTVRDRTVVIRMRRRARSETVEPFRQRIHEPQGRELRDQLAAWADQVRDRVDGAWPQMPDGVSDRPADVWEPLLAVADAAGGHWPERARAACVEIVTAVDESDKNSIGIRLLTELRDYVFRGARSLPTAQILGALNALEESPWGDLDGRPLDSRRLGRMLSEYVKADNTPVKARSIKTEGRVLRGYHADDLADAWARYCLPPPETAATSATSTSEATVTSTDEVADTPSNIRYLPATGSPSTATDTAPSDDPAPVGAPAR